MNNKLSKTDENGKTNKQKKSFSQTVKEESFIQSTFLQE